MQWSHRTICFIISWVWSFCNYSDPLEILMSIFIWTLIGYVYQLFEDDKIRIECLVQKLDDTTNHNVNSHVPNYTRMRKITLEEIEIGEWIYLLVKCDCNHFIQKTFPCWHFHAVTKRKPKKMIYLLDSHFCMNSFMQRSIMKHSQKSATIQFTF